MSAHRPGARLWPILLGVLLVAVIAALFLPSGWGRLGHQRKITLDRVQNAGGWAALRLQCEALLTNDSFRSYRDRGFWFPRSGSLPGGLAVLEPRRIQFEIHKNDPAIVKIQLFGTGKTDWTPYYGLWIACGAAATNYIPTVNQEGPHPYSVRRLSDAVFEVYQK